MLPTYKSTLLQVKAQRIIRTHIVKLLSTFDLSLSEWIILGNLHERGGVRLADIANLLSVEAPLVTSLVVKLQKRGYLEHKIDPFDKRAKLIALTKKAKTLVPKVEREMKKELRFATGFINEKEYAVYLQVLEAIVAKFPDVKVTQTSLKDS